MLIFLLVVALGLRLEEENCPRATSWKELLRITYQPFIDLEPLVVLRLRFSFSVKVEPETDAEALVMEPY